MGYSENNQYEGVPTFDDPAKLLVDMTDGDVGSNNKKKKEKKKKSRRCFWLCCSNVEIKNDKDKERAIEYLEKVNNSKKSCFFLCCTNIEVGPKI